MTDVVVVGARGLGKEVLGYLQEHGGYHVECVLDELAVDECLGYPVIHPSSYTGSCRDAILAIGAPQDKTWVLEKYAALGLRWVSFIHPKACVSRQASVGAGSIVAPFAAITGNAQVGDLVLVNLFAAIAHDAVIGSLSTLSPYAMAGGGAHIGRKTFLATGAKVLPRVRVGDHCRLSAGAMVHHDAADNLFLFGNPARSVPDIAMQADDAA